MQTLWSRTLRATKCTCRCQQCLSFSTAVARRTTTAARKRLLSLPSSTIFYSAIFACAAVADGRAKQQRREKWNHAIQEVKEELVPGDADADTRTLEGRGDEAVPAKERTKTMPDLDGDISRLEDMDPHDLAAILEQAASGAETPAAAEELMRKKLERARARGAEQDQYDATERELSDWEYAQRYTMLQGGRPDWPENTGPPFDSESFPPQSIYASDGRKIEGLESRWSRRKMQTMNLSMAKLVLRMCQEADLSMYPLLRKWDPALPECWIPENTYWVAIKEKEQKKKFLKRINDFLHFTKEPTREDQVPEFLPIFKKYPFYEQDAEGEFHRQCHSMNKRIFETFDKCFNGEINVPTLIGDVCEELLTAPAPPNITTYNALILGFTRLRQSAFTDIVIDSLHEVHMRPDEITCAAALTHYISTDNARQFTRFVQLMTGISTTNYALMLARPTLSLSHASTLARLQNRVQRHPRRRDRLIQKVRPTPRVMNAVVAGLLKFHGLERTIDICGTLAADGWGFDCDGLTRFLHACAERRDWEAGLAVWQQLQVLRAQRPPERPLERDAYLHMLGLCWMCDRVGAFEEVLREAEEVAGYRAGALEKDFEKMRRRGLDVFDAAAERRREWLLRHDMAAKFEAEGRLVELERERRRAAEGVVEEEEESAGPAAAVPPHPGKWRRGVDDGFGVGGDEIAWRPPAQEAPLQKEEENASGDQASQQWMTSARRGKKAENDDGKGDDWTLD